MRENCRSSSRAIPSRHCWNNTVLVWPASRCSRRSPTQTMGVRPASSAATVLFNTVSFVSFNHVRGSGRADHWPGYFAGECALLLPVQVLSPNLNAPAVRCLDGGRQIGERRTDDDFTMLGCCGEWPECLEKRASLGGGLEHFPVACHYGFSHRMGAQSTQIAPPRTFSRVADAVPSG